MSRREDIELGETLADASVEAGGAECDADLQLGDTVGRFHIVKKLGAGGMGIVYVALDPTLNRQIALKVLRRGHSGPLMEAENRSRMLREAQAMARLSHPNVIAVHEVGTVDEQVFIVMELNDGENLSDWCKTPRSWREVVGVFLEAGAGLAAAHDAGLIHRDFKPDNVLVARDGRVRVTDFGLVDSVIKAPEALSEVANQTPRPSIGGFLAFSMTETGAVLGTPAYMAPEQHNAEAADARTDQFSFCASMFEALYAVRPFTGSNYRELVINNLDGKLSDVPAGSDVPAELHALMLRGMKTVRDERFDSMQVLLAELRRLASPKPATLTVPIAATSRAGTEVTSPPASGQSWMFIGGALALATMAIVVFWFAQNRGGERGAAAPDAQALEQLVAANDAGPSASPDAAVATAAKSDIADAAPETKPAPKANRGGRGGNPKSAGKVTSPKEPTENVTPPTETPPKETAPKDGEAEDPEKTARDRRADKLKLKRTE